MLPTFAADRNIALGTAVAARLLTDPQYTEVLAREFNQAQPENEMKMRAVHPARDRYDFSPADAIVAFAATHGMKVRGHTLVWHKSIPGWVTAAPPDQRRDILRDHVRTVVSHYAGKVYAWDVVNEAVMEHGEMRASIWPAGYIEDAFRTAHAADPAALLFYNDYDTEVRNAKSDAVLALVRDLKQRGVPIHGVGFQCHLKASCVDKAAMIENLRRFTALGLEVQITELDVQLPVTGGSATPADLAQQARVYADVAGACVAVPNCTAIQTWGFTDRYSWIPHHSPGFGAALPFDADYRPKPAYKALHEALQLKP